MSRVKIKGIYTILTPGGETGSFKYLAAVLNPYCFAKGFGDFPLFIGI